MPIDSESDADRKFMPGIEGAPTGGTGEASMGRDRWVNPSDAWRGANAGLFGDSQSEWIAGEEQRLAEEQALAARVKAAADARGQKQFDDLADLDKLTEEELLTHFFGSEKTNADLARYWTGAGVPNWDFINGDPFGGGKERTERERVAKEFSDKNPSPLRNFTDAKKAGILDYFKDSPETKDFYDTAAGKFYQKNQDWLKPLGQVGLGFATAGAAPWIQMLAQLGFGARGVTPTGAAMSIYDILRARNDKESKNYSPAIDRMTPEGLDKLLNSKVGVNATDYYSTGKQGYDIYKILQMLNKIK